jgi:adenylate kinase family enzyme
MGMLKSKKKAPTQNELQIAEDEANMSVFKKNEKDIKSLIAPGGIDASYTNHLEIQSSNTRYARSMIVAGLPRMCTFPEFLRRMYTFGDINISVFINPLSESGSQTDLNRTINEIESERIVALDRGDINRERVLAQKREEAEELRDAIAAGFNKLFDSSIIATIFAYSMDELEKYTELLTSEMSKNLIDMKPAWALQDSAFRSNMPFCENRLNKSHTFDRRSMSTVFPFFSSEVGHENGIPLGFNKQTGLPILYDNFSAKLSNYNMVIFGKSGAGKSVTVKMLSARSSILMGIESLALDAER